MCVSCFHKDTVNKDLETQLKEFAKGMTGTKHSEETGDNNLVIVFVSKESAAAAQKILMDMISILDNTDGH